MCKVIREQDEYACSCGLRWGVGEEDPHLVVGFDPARPEGDRTVVNGHVLFKPSDFTEEEISRENVIAVAVVTDGLRVCMKCGDSGNEIDTWCQYAKSEGNEIDTWCQYAKSEGKLG